MRTPADHTQLLFERDAYHVCRLLSTQEFSEFCRKRHIHAPCERLEKLERLRIFLPVLRIWRFDVPIKIEFIDEGSRYIDHGVLEEGEVWSGDTKVELAGFDFSLPFYNSWRDDGFAWNPAFASVDKRSYLEEGHRHQAYYSQFQVFHLHRLMSVLTPHVEREWVIEDDGCTPSVPNGDSRAHSIEVVRHLIARCKDKPGIDDTALLCQLISDRYYPKTQTDERRFTVSADGRWDWEGFAKDWDAKKLVQQLEITKDELRKIYGHLSRAQDFADPMADWFHLCRFISLDRRKRLKGDALRAMTVREMAWMVRMLHKEAFDEKLPEPYEECRSISVRIPDVEPADDPMRALELIANEFHVNPKPQLVLFVEGDTEYNIIPHLVDRLWGLKLGVLGIELKNLKGIGNMTGKAIDSASALWRLVDYLHDHHTIALVLADSEGLAVPNLSTGLPRVSSTYLTDRRVTRKNYVRLWKKCFEFDNFNNREIALAMTNLGQTRITGAEVATSRESFRRGKAHGLESLYMARVSQPLRKISLANELVSIMFDETNKRDPYKRPISRFLRMAVELANRNHQPSTDELWQYNQRTGYFGTLKPGAVNRRKPLYGRRRRKK